MTDIVIVTSYYRPEYLWLSLEAIAAADGGAEKTVWIAHDHHPQTDRLHARLDAENDEVLSAFKGKFDKLVWHDREHNIFEGNSYNCLESYRRAYSTGARFVYLVEDDVLVADDFFRWHEALQARGDYFCTIGRPCPHDTSYIVRSDPAAYCESSKDYASLGVCWRRVHLAHVIRHAQAAYYQNMSGYIATNFRHNAMGRFFTEQDGLIQRVIMDGNGKRRVAWPCLKRAFHIGVTGYHRPNGPRFTGTLLERVEKLRYIVCNGQLAQMRKDFVALDDIDTPTPTPAWTEDQLYVSQTFGS